MLRSSLGRAAYLLIAMHLTGCQLPYILESAYDQARLLNSAIPLKEALANPSLSQEERRKLAMVASVKQFAVDELKLTPTKNYTSFVAIKRPYVTYVVSASEKKRLVPYQWHFPIIGTVPYKGYFDPRDAEVEQQKLKVLNYDTLVRGATAYSTLGWFRDPLLSSMLHGSDYDFVNVIIHETDHATLNIQSNADFNERLATFIGNKGAALYFQKLEGIDSPTLKRVQDETEDEKIFSEFISGEIRELDEWYRQREHQPLSESERVARLRLISERFAKQVRPKMRTNAYAEFGTKDLNNAVVLLYKTYVQDLDDFEKLYKKLNEDFHVFVARIKALEKASDPTLALKTML